MGRASRSYDDQLVSHAVKTFSGVGLRPYAPVHLRLVMQGGEVQASWLRRTRIDGDSWESVDVPLGEERERYVLRVLSGAMLLREEVLSAPGWTYTAAMQGADGAGGEITVTVAQISASFGPGPVAAAQITL